MPLVDYLCSHTMLVIVEFDGGAAVFKLEYWTIRNNLRVLHSHPSFTNRLAVSSGYGRVFVVAIVLRVDDSYTHRHLYVIN
ncbi:hypothetical protein Hdeb2414_s0414g00888741 [Helianthus debilis subsp. tardiflorus]